MKLVDMILKTIQEFSDTATEEEVEQALEGIGCGELWQPIAERAQNILRKRKSDV